MFCEIINKNSVCANPDTEKPHWDLNSKGAFRRKQNKEQKLAAIASFVKILKTYSP